MLSRGRVVACSCPKLRVTRPWWKVHYSSFVGGQFSLVTDSRLQELKRTWEASGSVEDEAAYLRERVRVGDLTQERLELAAYCGHEGASAAAGSPTPDYCDLEEFSRGLLRFPNAILCAAVVASRVVLPFWNKEARASPRFAKVADLPAAALQTVEEFLLGARTEETKARVRVAEDQLETCAAMAGDDGDDAAWTVLLTCMAVGAEEHGLHAVRNAALLVNDSRLLRELREGVANWATRSH